MTPRRLLLLACLLLASFTPIFAADLSASQIMEKVMKAQDSNSSALDLTLTLRSPKDEDRQRRLQTLTLTAGGKTSSLTVFISPTSVKNTRFLSLENAEGKTEQWIYLPALKKVRRISATEEGGSFMGSDFSYTDMASTTYDQDSAKHTLMAEDAQSYTVESIPYDSGTYGKTVTKVDKETFLPLQVSFYDKDGQTLLKTLVTEKTADLGGRMMTTRMVMTTIESGHSTVLEMLQAQFDQKLNPAYFTTKFLETGRI